MQPKTLNHIAFAIILSLGIGSCGYFISQTLFNAKVAINVAEVKGLAERQVQADTAIWTLTFGVANDISAPLASLYRHAETRQQTIFDFLRRAGFDTEELEIGVIDYSKREYRDSNQKLIEQRHSLRGSITITTSKVELVANARASINNLIAEGIAIDNHNPRYLFTQLNQIKPAMLREATENARIAANEFAHIAQVEVGAIKHARQGSFVINDSGEQYSSDQKVTKDVRVVTTVSFYLEE